MKLQISWSPTERWWRVTLSEFQTEVNEFAEDWSAELLDYKITEDAVVIKLKNLAGSIHEIEVSQEVIMKHHRLASILSGRQFIQRRVESE